MQAMFMLATAHVDYSVRAQEFFFFKYDFVRDALFASSLVGATCAVVGCFLILRGLSLLGDAAGHSTLPGLCFAFLMSGSMSPGVLFVGALGSSFLSAMIVGVIARAPRTRPDAAIGIVLSVFFGVGIVLLSYIQTHASGHYAGLESMLLGNVAGITSEQIVTLSFVSVLLLGGVWVFYRPLMLSTFDAEFACALGVPVRVIHYGLLGALSLSVVVSIQAVGVVLVSAMLIIPPSAAFFIAPRMRAVLAWSGLLGALSGACGAFVSYMFEGISTGPAMVLVAALFFCLAILFGPHKGVVARAVRKRAYGKTSVSVQTLEVTA